MFRESGGMGVKMVSLSIIDFQGNSTALATVPLDRPRTIFYSFSIATISLFCTVSDILCTHFPKLEEVAPLNTSRWG